MAKVQDAMIILSEREANRILLSSNKINRNPFVDHESPKLVLQNKSWYDFLISQIQKRWQIKCKLFELVPQLFPDCETSFQVELTNLMFTEIKRRRQALSSLQKESYLINLQTEFQELLLRRSQNKKVAKFVCKVMTKDHYDQVEAKKQTLLDEVVTNKEVDLL
jgi:hypothetical protein